MEAQPQLQQEIIQLKPQFFVGFSVFVGILCFIKEAAFLDLYAGGTINHDGYWCFAASESFNHDALCAVY